MKKAGIPAFFITPQSHCHRPIHVERGYLSIHGQQTPLRLDLDRLVTEEIHRLLGGRRGARHRQHDGLPADHAAPVQDELGLHLWLHKLSTTVYRLTPRAINDGSNKWKFSKHRLNTIT